LCSLLVLVVCLDEDELLLPPHPDSATVAVRAATSVSMAVGDVLFTAGLQC
jgi:hypothetical protein